MATISNITTGEQTVSATGAITGTLDTSGLSGDYTVKLRVSGLSAGKKIMIALEDTANASAFSDALQCAVFHVVGGATADGNYNERKNYDIPMTRFGAANTKLRFNTLAIDSSPGTVLVYGWLEQ